MKQILAILITLLLRAGGVQAQQPPQIAERVALLIGSNDFHALDLLSREEYESLPPVLQHLTDTTVGSRFNDLHRSCTAIETLFNEHYAELDGPMQNWLFGMLLGNLRIMHEYEQAAQIATMLRGATDDEASKKTLDGMMRWFGALAQYPKTRISRPEGDITLPLHLTTSSIRNALGESVEIRTLFTEVEIGGQTEQFIFDTGCSNSSFVSEEFAAKHGIRIVCDSILVTGAATTTYAHAGVLDSIRVGPITVYNPTFLIMPAFEGVDTLYKIPPVLGTDFMNLVGELQLYPNEGKILLPDVQTPLPDAGRNLTLDTQSGAYSLRMICDGEPVTMFFDTGSVYTDMGALWFEKHKDRVLAEGRRKEIGIGGFGGTSRGYGYELPSLSFGLGESVCTIPLVSVHSDIQSSLATDQDGTLGTNFILAFDKVTINFDRMFVTAE